MKVPLQTLGTILYSLLFFLSFTSTTLVAQQADRTPISLDSNRPSANPRLVRVGSEGDRTDIIAAVAPGVLYESLDEGNSFHKIAKIDFRSEAVLQCCAVLYEVPRSVGSIKAGSLLYSADFCYRGMMSTDIYSSQDHGRSWTFIGAPVQGGACRDGKAVKKDGLWEPDFEVSADGALVMFWSDETDPCCSQKLSQVRTFDGSHWQDRRDTVALANRAARPGMAVVSKTPSGTYFMTYELCGTANCDVMYRTSRDGWNFGPVTNSGKKIITKSGRYFEHAPRNIWFGLGRGSDAAGAGELVVIGQVLHEANGSISPQDGEIIFRNSSQDGAGEWTSAPAPVKVANAASGPYNVCQNYSSSLLPVHDGRGLLELASDWNDQHLCTSFFGSESFHP
jgi:hypothetical protein